MTDSFENVGGSQLPFGLAALARRAFAEADLRPLWRTLTDRLHRDPEDAASLLDLSVLVQLAGDRARALALQAAALQRQRLFEVPLRRGARPTLHLLAFLAPGDFMANTPLELLLEESDVRLTLCYVGPGGAPPAGIPPHDLAIVAVTESDENRRVLAELEPLVAAWPRPVLNRPARIATVARDALGRVLASTPGLVLPPTLRTDRAALAAIGAGAEALDGLGAFPLIIRPAGSHAGHGLAKLEVAADLRQYLEDHADASFFLAPFIDYRGADGLFRKARIALIDGQPYACHLAVSEHWMVHYLNAGMTESPAKRAEEARFFDAFDTDFVPRHRRTLDAIVQRLGLDYVALDCAELPDGRLLLFEADNAMIIHAMDPPALFPYKPQQMRRVFQAFQALLVREARRGCSAYEVGAPRHGSDVATSRREGARGATPGASGHESLHAVT